MQATQHEKAAAFRALHEGEAFVVPNPWDAGSATVLAGLGFNLYQSDVIYSNMLAYAGRFPDSLFIASPGTMEALLRSLGRRFGQEINVEP